MEMEIDIDSLKKKLTKTNQEHVLTFWDELNEEEKNILSKQIEEIDFEQIENLYAKSKEDTEFNINEISPIKYLNSLEMQNKEKFIKIGEDIIKNGELAVISMAGGQRNKTSVTMDQKLHLN